jgi:hypothetical protein
MKLEARMAVIIIRFIRLSSHWLYVTIKSKLPRIRFFAPLTQMQPAERGAALTQRLLVFGRRQMLAPELIDLPALVRNMSMLLTSSLVKACALQMRFPDTLRCVEVDLS